MTFQCISVLIQSDSSSEQDTECFTFRISAANTVSGLTVDPAQASVCIIDQGGKYVSLHCSYTYTYAQQHTLSIRSIEACIRNMFGGPKVCYEGHGLLSSTLLCFSFSTS